MKNINNHQGCDFKSYLFTVLLITFLTVFFLSFLAIILKLPFRQLFALDIVKKTATETGYENLQKPAISEAIAKALKERNEINVEFEPSESLATF